MILLLLACATDPKPPSELDSPPVETTETTDPTETTDSTDTADTTDTPCTALSWYPDDDGDGHGDPASPVEQCDPPTGAVATGDDCDDARADVYPGAPEICGPDDHDCDGVAGSDEADATDASTFYADRDGDGWGDPDAPVVACEPPPGSVACEGGCDADCRDGSCNADCDDTSAEAHPGGEELCTASGDPVDEDCDGRLDADAIDALPWYADLDGDGFGDPSVVIQACITPAGFGADATDCADDDAEISPAAAEICNDLDDDCDGLLDEPEALDAGSWYADLDGDGWGAGAATVACEAPAGSVSSDNDCDDTRPEISPSAAEICDTSDTDEDCSGLADDLDPGVDPAGLATWYPDADLDGWGDAATPILACDTPAGALSDGTDCGDLDPGIHPFADEYCDTVDADCDGDPAEDDALDAPAWTPDGDGDGHGDPAGAPLRACAAPSGYGAPDDCDDAAAAVYPGAPETCEADDGRGSGSQIDNDCDGAVDDALDVPTWHRDDDGDGHGVAESLLVCIAIEPFSSLNEDDCDDTDVSVSPDATEICDARDDDCDGAIDEGVTTDFYADADGDGAGDPTVVLPACALPAGYAAGPDDCDDADPGAHPGAREDCATSADDDCSGDPNDRDALGCVAVYEDADLDGHGGAGSVCQCEPDAAFPAIEADDCDDTDTDVHPGALEICDDRVDNDCDGGAGDCHPQSGSLAGALAFPGTVSGDIVGYAVSPAGDVNADGYADMLVGAPHNGVAGRFSGAFYLLLGRADPAAGSLAAGAFFTGETASAVLGYTVGGAVGDALGDVNGDGYDDVVAGAPYEDDGGYLGGAAYLVLGSAAPASASITAHIQYTGDADMHAGCHVAVLGDVNDDGFADLGVGAYGDGGGGLNAGAAFLILGSPTPADAFLSSTLVYTGDANWDYAGRSVNGAGDVNGDGFADMLVGAVGEDSGGSLAGAAYLVLGSATPASDDLANQVIYAGMAADDIAGRGTAAAGDVDADGYADVLIGAQGDDRGGVDAGAAWLVLGGPTPASAPLDDFLRYTGVGAGDCTGYAVSGAGDVNADGFADLLVGGRDNDDAAANAGIAWLVLGSASPAAGSLADAIGLFGTDANDEAGFAVAGVGDVDADGDDDVLIGAYNNDDGVYQGGNVYLVLGTGL